MDDAVVSREGFQLPLPNGESELANGPTTELAAVVSAHVAS